MSSEEHAGIGLKNLMEMVRTEVSSRFTHPYWVRAEIRSVSSKAGGHCYIDLADKDEKGMVCAQARGIIWASQWSLIQPYFQKHTGRTLEVGMNILIRASVQFSEMYGLSLIINDIDPSFTAGEIEMRRQMTIARLTEEGMMEMNSILTLPELPRRFAVISSPTAAGYGDFMNHLHNNGYGFSFVTALFEAPMQGDGAPEGIVAALDRILEVKENFDAVLLMRGGGSVADLSCFDDYDLCAAIAQFPIPVMCAIGHDRDVHIADMVSNVTVKTPTALADYIVDIFVSEDEMISSLATRLSLAVVNKCRQASSRLDLYGEKIKSAVRSRFLVENSFLDASLRRLERSNPFNLMKEGYPLLFKAGHRTTSVSELRAGDTVEILFSDGTVVCDVNEVKA